MCWWRCARECKTHRKCWCCRCCCQCDFNICRNCLCCGVRVSVRSKKYIDASHAAQSQQTVDRVITSQPGFGSNITSETESCDVTNAPFVIASACKNCCECKKCCEASKGCCEGCCETCKCEDCCDDNDGSCCDGCDDD